MSRPRLIETTKFGGCRDWDSSRLKNLEDVETETHRDSSKGVETETETETESLATHCSWVLMSSNNCHERSWAVMSRHDQSGALINMMPWCHDHSFLLMRTHENSAMNTHETHQAKDPYSQMFLSALECSWALLKDTECTSVLKGLIQQ